MEIIYKPKGKAGEYAELALNIYKGCTHSCRYCYCPGIMRKTREQFFSHADPKKDIIEKVKKDARKLAKLGNCPEILISFIGDPYQPAEKKAKLTRFVLWILMDYHLPFTILSKGGYLAARDFSYLAGYPKARFGTSLSLYKKDDVEYWEPGTPSFKERTNTIRKAKELCIKTWVSLEPVIDPEQALWIIETFHNLVDHWKIGKINHNKEIESQVDWLRFRESAVELLDKLGADYYLKKSLTELL